MWELRFQPDSDPWLPTGRVPRKPATFPSWTKSLSLAVWALPQSRTLTMVLCLLSGGLRLDRADSRKRKPCSKRSQALLKACRVTGCGAAGPMLRSRGATGLLKMGRAGGCGGVLGWKSLTPSGLRVDNYFLAKPSGSFLLALPAENGKLGAGGAGGWRGAAAPDW